MELLLSEAETAYIAGLFDGEGMVRIYKNPPSANGKRYAHRYGLCMSVTNTKRGVLDWLATVFGGGVYTELNAPRSTRPRHVWRLLGTDRVAAILERLRPYMWIKNYETWIALEFRAAITRTARIPIREEEAALREGFYLALREAKRS